MIGPVHEKLTSTSVSAMKNIESSPVVEEAFSSIFVDHDEGNVISKPPRKEAANTTSSANRKRLK